MYPHYDNPMLILGIIPWLRCRLVVAAAAQIRPFNLTEARNAPSLGGGGGRGESSTAEADDVFGVADALGENLSLLRIFDDEVLWSNGVRDINRSAGGSGAGGGMVGGAGGAMRSSEGSAGLMGLGQILDLGADLGSDPGSISRAMTQLWGEDNKPGRTSAEVDLVGGPKYRQCSDDDDGVDGMEPDAEMVEFLKASLLEGEDLEGEAAGTQREADEDRLVGPLRGGAGNGAGTKDVAAVPEDASDSAASTQVPADPAASDGGLFDAFPLPTGGGVSLVDFLSLGGGSDAFTSKPVAAAQSGKVAHLKGSKVRGDMGPQPTQATAVSPRSEAQELAEALELLPDLDAMAEKICIKYDGKFEMVDMRGML